MNILIVDDESVSRTKLEAILGEFGECRAVTGGREAIAEVGRALREQKPYDLITMDIGMPEIDGTEALYEIRKLEEGADFGAQPKARIIMVTAQKDRDSLITCVQAGCDDYIIKPFDPELVIQRLLAHKLPGVKEWVEKQHRPSREIEESDKVAIGKEVLSLFQRGEISLPSPPGIYSAFRKMIERGADVAEIADLLKEDISISFHLISVSNSPYYRGVKENRSLQQAIGRLGLELTKKYVDLLSNRSLFTVAEEEYQPIMVNLWQHSLACANAAEILTSNLQLHLEHDPFTLGILHDVGKMVLIQIVAELEGRGKIGHGTNRADILSTLAAYHGPFGKAVLAQWGFAEEFGIIAQLHDDLDSVLESSDALPIVQLSNLISKASGYGLDRPEDIDLLDSPPARKLGIDAEMLENVRGRLAELMEETQKALE